MRNLSLTPDRRDLLPPELPARRTNGPRPGGAGQDVIVVPLYLPILLDADGLDNDVERLFGGVNVFLQQSPACSNTPLVRQDSRLVWMLRRAAKREARPARAIWPR